MSYIKTHHIISLVSLPIFYVFVYDVGLQLPLPGHLCINKYDSPMRQNHFELHHVNVCSSLLCLSSVWALCRTSALSKHQTLFSTSLATSFLCASSTILTSNSNKFRQHINNDFKIKSESRKTLRTVM